MSIDMYIQQGINICLFSLPVAFVVFCVFTALKFLVKRKIEFRPWSMLCEFAWIVIVLTILEITGIIYGDYQTTSIFSGNAQISFGIFEEGLSAATILNFLLFVPFGFLSAIVFVKLQKKWFYGILIGLAFSILIEFLQTFTGRYAQLDDVLMNTLGTFLGYEIWGLVSNIKLKRKQNAVQ